MSLSPAQLAARAGRLTASQRFEEKFIPEPNSGCWIWQASLYRNGYGQFGMGSRKLLAHRWAYENLVGPIPDGMVLDHKCRIRCCVNPTHLEPVTCRENIVRGVGPSVVSAFMRAKTHCKNGHLYDDANSFVSKRGFRVCRTCRNIKHERWVDANRDRVNSRRREGARKC